MGLPLLTFLGVITVLFATAPILIGAAQALIAGFAKNKYLKNSYTPEILHVAVLIPAWNEANVLTESVERMLSLSYPEDYLRVYVVDDASTDNTPSVMKALVAKYGETRVAWLRRDVGGEGKAHTLNHGLGVIENSNWAEAVLITDADVLFTPNSLLRMVRHFADPKIGAVTGYVKEGSEPGNYMNRFISYEYATAQAVARRAWNVLGSQLCLAGGAQLLRMDTLKKIGGRIDTETLAEDTVTTFETQLVGNKVVFEPAAIVWAEEPGSIRALWGQRLRWGRGNIQVSLKYKHVWGRWKKHPGVGSPFFAAAWFAVMIQPILMFLATISLLALYFANDEYAFVIFRYLWIISGLIYLLLIAAVAAADPKTMKKSWPEAFFYPGIITTFLLWISLFPTVAKNIADHIFLMADLTSSEKTTTIAVLTLGMYSWLTLSVLFAYLAKVFEKIPKIGPAASRITLWIGGYGPLLCAITTAAIVSHIRGANTEWVKTVKVGKVQIGEVS